MARKSPNTQQSLLDGQQELPIQAVSDPILNSPYSKPTAYWDYDRDSGMAQMQTGRRPARYYYKLRSDEAAKKAGQALLALDEGQRDLPLIKALREDVERWRETSYRGAQQVTKDLLEHWNREDRYRRFFFCQLEAVETIIFLAEMRYKRPDGTRYRPQFNPRLLDNEFATFLDTPSGEDSLPLLRYGCKMATGSGKTVVMAMLIAWTLCNRGQQPTDLRFPRSILVCCPNLTVKERLQVLRPDSIGNYYEAFDIVPARLRPLLSSGKVLVTNWHGFRPEGEHTALGVTNPVQQLGQESDDAFARRLLGDLYDGAKNGGLLVLNDEAHHAYRPKPLEPTATLTAAQKAERTEATVWVDGLDRFNRAVGVAFCSDLSATPF
jgi:type III restriction enzyme